MTYGPLIIPAQGGLQTAQGKVVYETFNRLDGTVLTGNPCSYASAGYTKPVWSVSANPSAFITQNNRLQSDLNGYCLLDFAQNVEYIFGSFVFSIPDSGQCDLSESTVTLIADKGPIILDTMLHFIISATGWAVQKRIGSGSFDFIASGAHYLQVDGRSVYTAAMQIDAAAGTVVIYPPQGEAVTVTDPDITTINPQRGVIQIFNTTGPFSEWNSFGMGANLADRFVAPGGAAQIGDIRFLIGDGITQKRPLSATIPNTGGGGGVGWYRLATDQTLITFLLAGTVSITASVAGVGPQVILMNMTAVQSAVSQFTQMPNLNIANVIDKARISWDGSGHFALDIHVSNGTSAIDLEVEFEGFFKPTNPGFVLVGATALTSGQSILTLQTPSVNTFSSSLVGGSTGWYRFGLTTPNWIGFGMGGIIQMQLTDSGNNKQILEFTISINSTGSPFLQQTTNIGINWISQVRLTWDGASTAYLDIYSGYTTALTISGSFFGQYSIASLPALGVSALANSQVYPLPQYRVIGGFLSNLAGGNETTTYVTPSTGDTVTIPNECTRYVIDTGLLAALTIKLPALPELEGEPIQIGFVGGVTTLTIQANSGQSLAITPPTTAAAGASISLYFRLTNLSWYP